MPLFYNALVFSFIVLEKLLTISLLFLTAFANAQEPAMLSIEGVGGNGYDYVYAPVTNTSDGGGIIRFYTGSDQSTGNINTQCNQTTTQKSSVFRKYDGNGMVEWEKCYVATDDTTWTYLFPLPGGGVILGGDGVNNQQFLIRKEAADGSIIWSKSYGGSAGDRLVNMKACADGGYIMVGNSNSDNGDVGFHYGSIFSFDIWVIKVDSNGDKLWGKVIGGTNDENVFAVTEVPDGYYIVGKSSSNDYDVVGNHGGSDLFISRLDDTGHIIWTKCLGGSDHDGYHNGWAVEDGNGGVLIGTNTVSQDGDIIGNNGLTDFWMIGLDSNASITINKCYGTASFESVSSICRATDGTLWMCGLTGGNAKVFHTDNTGNIIHEQYFPAIGNCQVRFLLPLLSGMVLAGGIYDTLPAPGTELPQSWYGLTDVFIAKLAPWTTGLNAEAKEPINVYPNPTRDIIFIDIPGRQGYVLTIRDLLGRNIYSSGEHTSGVEIDVRRWPRGVYYVQLASEGKWYTTRLVVQ